MVIYGSDNVGFLGNINIYLAIYEPDCRVTEKYDLRWARCRHICQMLEIISSVSYFLEYAKQPSTPAPNRGRTQTLKKGRRHDDKWVVNGDTIGCRYVVLTNCVATSDDTDWWRLLVFFEYQIVEQKQWHIHHGVTSPTQVFFSTIWCIYGYRYVALND